MAILSVNLAFILYIYTYLYSGAKLQNKGGYESWLIIINKIRLNTI